MAVILVLCLASVAGSTWAATEAELEAEASDLLAAYESLETAMNSCANGTCSGAQALLDSLDAVSAELASLRSDRSTLQGCGCQSLDGLLSDLDDLDDALQLVRNDWEEGTRAHGSSQEMPYFMPIVGRQMVK